MNLSLRLTLAALWLAVIPGFTQDSDRYDPAVIFRQAHPNEPAKTVSILGRVVDATLAPIKGVAVELKFAGSTEIITSMTTGDKGEFTFSVVPHRTYEIVVYSGNRQQIVTLIDEDTDLGKLVEPWGDGAPPVETHSSETPKALLRSTTEESSSVGAKTENNEPIRTTLCELQSHPEQFSRKFVRIRATLESNFEMAVLTDTSCPRSDVMIWYGSAFGDFSQTALIASLDDLKEPNEIQWHSATPLVFHVTEESKRLDKYCRKHAKKLGEVKYQATFIGRFDYIANWLAVKKGDGKVLAVSAYGHQNCCKARLEPESIADISLPRK